MVTSTVAAVLSRMSKRAMVTPPPLTPSFPVNVLPVTSTVPPSATDWTARPPAWSRAELSVTVTPVTVTSVVMRRRRR